MSNLIKVAEKLAADRTAASEERQAKFLGYLQENPEALVEIRDILLCIIADRTPSVFEQLRRITENEPDLFVSKNNTGSAIRIFSPTAAGLDQLTPNAAKEAVKYDINELANTLNETLGRDFFTTGAGLVSVYFGKAGFDMTADLLQALNKNAPEEAKLASKHLKPMMRACGLNLSSRAIGPEGS